jgi:hypothetical protein
MKPQFSRTLALTSGQLVLNLFLASWLVSEYLHNPFMRQYLSNLWTANVIIISVGIVLVAVVGSGSYLTIFRRMSPVDSSDRSTTNTSSAALTALDVCPVCDNPLKELSPNRFQCKSCHRYFKK